jgi:heparin/heparan-sulfate lyase
VDLFLNVMQIMDGSASREAVQSVESSGGVGAQIGQSVVLFSRDGKRLDRTVSFTIKGDGTFRYLVTDLAEGTWRVLRNESVVNSAASVKAEEGTLWFEGPAGTYRLQR